VTLGEVLPEASVEVCTRPLPRGAARGVAAARGFWADVRGHRPDLLHLHYAGGRLGTLATLSGCRPLAVTVMGGDVLPEQHLSGHTALERRATRRILEQADAILAKADALHPAIVALGGPPDRIETVRWGIDPLRFRPEPEAAARLRHQLGLAPQARVILSPRLLRPLYNIDKIVEAMPRVLAAAPEALLLITSDRQEAGYRSAIDRRVAALGIDSCVRFTGRIAHGDMPGLYSLAEVVVSVPSSDGLPQTLFESMACETPAVLGDLLGYREVVRDGETARLTEIAPEAIGGAIAELLGNSERRKALGHAARQRVIEVASLPRELDRVEACYRAALMRPRPRSTRPLATALDLIGLGLR
jgi:glycosyltransferase involved in cell wall biosynthesis